MIHGGGQENNLRSGTNTLALSASLAKALRLSIEGEASNFKKVKVLSERLLGYLKDNKDKYLINSYNEDNPYIVNFSLLHRTQILHCL